MYFKENRKIATIKKNLLSFRPKFTIDVNGPNDYEIAGDFIGHEYSINKGSDEVARISKRFFSMSDSYGVELKGGSPILMINAVVVIDLMLHKKRKTAY